MSERYEPSVGEVMMQSKRHGQHKEKKNALRTKVRILRCYPQKPHVQEIKLSLTSVIVYGGYLDNNYTVEKRDKLPGEEY